ncbi:MAG: glycosyl hydrolase family 28-related protein [Acidobacteriota bacterium]
MKRFLVLILCALMATNSVAQDKPLDSKRTGFAPSVVRFTNLAPQDVTTWASLSGAANVTTGVSAPDGTTDAAKLSIVSPTTGYKRLYGTTRSVSVDDRIIAGVWVKAVSLSSGLSEQPSVTLNGEAVATVRAADDTAGYKFDIDGFNYRDLTATTKADTEWEWVTTSIKIASAPPGIQARLQFDLSCTSNRQIAFFAPVLLHIPSGQLTDDEADTLLQNLYSVPDNISPGTVATLRGQSFQSKLRDAGGAVLDVRTLGAKADGVSDDLAPIMAALTATAGTGVPVQLPAGTIKLSTTLTVPGGTIIKGAGYDKTIISSTANAPIVDAVRGAGVYQFSGPVISDIKIVGSKTAGSSQIGLKTDDPLYYANGDFAHIRIVNAGSHGMYVGKAFSSRFVDIYSGDNNGYPFVFDVANMPANHYESLYAQDVVSPYNAGYRVRSGEVHCIACNGVNVSPVTSWWAIVGDKTGTDGATDNRSAYFECWNCNVESSRAGGVLLYTNSLFVPKGATKFAGDGGSSGSYIAIKYEIDSSIFPPYFAKGKIDDTVTFANSYSDPITGTVATSTATMTVTGTGTLFLTELIVGQLLVVGANTYKIATITNNLSLTLTANASATVSGSAASKVYYKDGFPIHANDLPTLMIDGQGPKIAGNAHQTDYYNTTNSRSEPLYRADGYYPRITVTGTASYSNPGPRYFETNCASNCTLTLPWPGWYQPAGEPVVIKNLSATSVVVTVNSGGGGTVNTSGLSLSTQYDSVVLLPDSAALDWRVVAKYSPAGAVTGSGASTRLAVWNASNDLTSVSGLTYDAGSSVVTSPGRFWGANTAAGAPTFAFNNDYSTGMFLSGANTNLGFAVNGGEKFDVGLTSSFFATHVTPEAAATRDLGSTTLSWRRGYFDDYLRLTETTAPSTPSGNTLALYAKDKSGVSALYYKDDGGTEHDLSAAGGGNHNLLSSTHTDTTAGTVARGDIITGQGGSATWTRLAKGSSGNFLGGDGTDTAWKTLSGTTDQIMVGDSSGNLTLSTPQSINTTSTPQFAQLGLGTAASSTNFITGSQTVASTGIATNVETYTLLSSGTPGANFGLSHLYRLKSAGGSAVDAAGLSFSWTTATGGSETGRIDFNTNLTGLGIGPAFSVDGSQYYGISFDKGSVSGSVNINFINGNAVTLTLTGNITTLTFSNIRAGANYVLHFIQDSTGSRTLTKPSTLKVNGGLTLTTTANRRDVLFCNALDSSNLYCVKGLDVQ